MGLAFQIALGIILVPFLLIAAFLLLILTIQLLKLIYKASLLILFVFFWPVVKMTELAAPTFRRINRSSLPLLLVVERKVSALPQSVQSLLGAVFVAGALFLFFMIFTFLFIFFSYPRAWL